MNNREAMQKAFEGQKFKVFSPFKCDISKNEDGNYVDDETIFAFAWFCRGIASQAQQTESQWISVEERLPEEHEDVILLILDEYDQIQHAHGFYWKYHKADRIVWNQNSDFCTPQGGWDGATMDKDELNVTHWMPLPPAPEGDKL